MDLLHENSYLYLNDIKKLTNFICIKCTLAHIIDFESNSNCSELKLINLTILIQFVSEEHNNR